MDRRQLIKVAVVLAIVIAIIAVALLYIRSLGITTGPRYWILVNLSDPVRIDNGSWAIEVVNVTGHYESHHANIEEFDVMMRKEGSVAIPFQQLRNGLVANSNDTYVFFEDNGKIGRMDTGDVFYLIGLKSESDYEFRLRSFDTSANTVSVQT